MEPATVELDSRLLPYLDLSSPVPCLHHPLVHASVYAADLNASLNDALAAKHLAVSAARQAADAHTEVMLHERPWRARALARLAPAIDDATYWALVRQVFVDTDHAAESALWGELLASPRPHRHHVMSPAERHALAELGDEVCVYRGHTSWHDDGFCWTTRRDVAEQCARRSGLFDESPPLLSRATAPNDRIIAYLLDRDECEVLLDPTHLVGRRVERLAPAPPPRTADLSDPY
jgi:hypothetical protein